MVDRSNGTASGTVTDEAASQVAEDELVDEVLVEEVSIDGMCGVY